MNAQISINELSSKNDNVILDEFGASSDWIELYNSSNTTINLEGYYLSDEIDTPLKWTFPNLSIPPQSFLLIFASDLDLCQTWCHTNFKLSSDGEALILSDETGMTIDQISFPALEADQSYGRIEDGNPNWAFFNSPTPFASNNTSTSIDFADLPTFSVENRFHNEAIQVELNCTAPNCFIYYTLDGSEPSIDHFIYNNPITIDTTTTIRARAFSPLSLPSKIATQTYFIQTEHELPIMAITSDPHYLYDWEEGILVSGPNADAEWPHFGANFWEDTEIPMHAEYFIDKNLELELDLGSKVHGGKTSRTKVMKSLRLLGKSSFGSDRVNYPFFYNKDITNFKRVVLRNASGDFNFTHFRDAYLQRYFIDQNLNLDVLAHQPAVVYINGAYYGLMNIREKVDKYYLENNYNVDIDNIDLLEEDTMIVEGNFDVFNLHYDFVMENDLSQQANYDIAKSYFDIKNIADYVIVQTAVNNTDWPGNNMKFWRERKPDAKWRYLLFDMDVGMGRHGWTHADFNSFGGLLNPNTDNEFVKIVLSLLQNETYRNYFVNRYADLLNTTFRENNWKAETDKTVAEIDTEIKRHFQKWTWPGYDVWQNDRLVGMYEFIADRRTFARGYVKEHFALENEVLLQIQTYPENAGTIHVNSITPSELPWDGYYYNGVPVELTILPNNGFTFSHWQSLNTILEKDANQNISYNFEQDDEITAFFEVENPTTAIEVYPTLFQNEINVEVILSEISEIEIRLFDTMGRLIDFRRERKNAGNQPILLKTNNLARGAYFLQIKINDEYFTQKVMHF